MWKDFCTHILNDKKMQMNSSVVAAVGDEAGGGVRV
jgi:hypothetical protein